MQSSFDFSSSTQLVAGVDEVGRGPLAGPVVTAAVILDPNQPIDGLTDSKTVSEKKRERLFDEIREKALAWAIGRCEVEEIEELNILRATMTAMQRAVAGLSPQPEHALIDGNRYPRLPCSCEFVIKGDSKVEATSTASILAKVTRDREMVTLDQKYPGYSLASHKGYPTKAHITALKELGVTPIHNRSFGPVRKVLEGE